MDVRERHRSAASLTLPPPETEPTTQAGALNGNQTCSLLVYSMRLQPTETPTRASPWLLTEVPVKLSVELLLCNLYTLMQTISISNFPQSSPPLSRTLHGISHLNYYILRAETDIPCQREVALK